MAYLQNVSKAHSIWVDSLDHAYDSTAAWSSRAFIVYLTTTGAEIDKPLGSILDETAPRMSDRPGSVCQLANCAAWYATGVLGRTPISNNQFRPGPPGVVRISVFAPVLRAPFLLFF